MKISHMWRLMAALIAGVLVLAACTSDSADDTTASGSEGDVELTDDAGPTDDAEPADDAEATDDAADDSSAASGERVSTYIGQPESLSPTDNTESEGNAVLSALFTTLIEYDTETNEPVMANAASIETDDNQTFTVTLNEGWTFHDGTPVTAESYVNSWNYAALGPNAQSTAGFFVPIAGYEDMQCGTVTDADGEDVADCDAAAPAADVLAGLTVVSDTEFTIELTEPEAFFITRLGYPAYAPLPTSFYDDPDAFDRAPVGNGPFMMNGEWEDDIQILTDAYPDYQGTPAQISGIEFRIYADVNTAVTDLIAGNLDIVDLVPPEQWDTVTAEVPNAETSANSGLNYIGFPTYAPPFDNATLRAALSMAIDREAITEGIFNGLRQPAFNLLTPVIPGYEEIVCDNWTFNPELAATMFEEAGGLDTIGDSLEVWFNEGGGHDLWMDAVITQWEQNLGIPASSVTFQQLPFAEYLALQDSRGLTGPFRLGWGMDYPHPQNYLQILLGLTADEGGNNATFWTNDEYLGLVDEALAVPDVEESLPVWQEANAVACSETPVAPMFYAVNTFAWNDGVSGVAVNAFGNLVYSALTHG